MDQFPEKIDSKFRYVLVAANRAEQLMRGARPKMEAANRKPTVMAMDELNSDLVGWDLGPAPEPEPEPEPEVEVTMEEAVTEEVAEED